MRSKTIIAVGLVILFAASSMLVATFKAYTSESVNSNQVKEIPITVKQLESQNGIIPVELRCDDVKLNVPNKLENISCRATNNTDKNIFAVVVTILITFEQQGQKSLDSSNLAIEKNLHPDYLEEHKDTVIHPGEQAFIQTNPTTYDDDAVVKEILMQIDYVEFKDTTTLGNDRFGSKLLKEVREGAAKYKNWLAKKYEESGKSETRMVNLLQKNQPIPEELNLKGRFWEGAFQYRNFLRRSYEAKGREIFNKYLTKSITEK